MSCKKMEEEETLLLSFYEALIPKPERNITGTENYKIVSLIDIINLNKI